MDFESAVAYVMDKRRALFVRLAESEQEDREMGSTLPGGIERDGTLIDKTSIIVKA